MPRETGKQRASGIPLDYFRHRNPLERGKLLLAGAAAIVTVIWFVGGSLIGRPAEAWYSPGHLTAAHASFEMDCLKCHVSFTPIVSNSALAVDAKALDQRCQQCHKVRNSADEAGHHALQGSALLACSSCHHEHRGSAASLVATADASCTSCHAQIAVHRAPPLLTPPVADASHFDAEHHPEFRSIKTDPRKFKFSIDSHHRHQTDGFPDAKDHKEVMTAGLLSTPADKARYAPGAKESDYVHGLTCDACHRLDGPDARPIRKDGSLAAGSSIGSGAYMTPIVYENQCRACHLLTVDPGIKTSDSKTDHRFDVIPHRLQGTQLTAEVTKYWEDRFLRDNPQQTERPLPLPSHPSELEDRTARETIAKNVGISLAHLRRNCEKCHVLADDGVSPAPQVVPVKIPQPWLEYAEFDHTAHRAEKCTACHGAADPTAPANDATASPTMIPGRNVCIRCHSPLQESADSPHGGARTDCVECHRFHSPDNLSPLAPSTLAPQK